MSEPEHIEESPVGWVRDHIDTYLETDGRQGHILQGRPTLLMTIRGRKSGVLRRTGATYGTDGDDFIIIDSNGGSANTPEWSLNLRVIPELDIRVGSAVMRALAVFTIGDERQRLWNMMLQVEELLPMMQARTRRRFSVIRLRPIKDPTHDPLANPTDPDHEQAA
jgi:deazaflavin-dependent oxidoreductase (nitroreductase family)